MLKRDSMEEDGQDMDETEDDIGEGGRSMTTSETTEALNTWINLQTCDLLFTLLSATEALRGNYSFHT